MLSRLNLVLYGRSAKLVVQMMPVLCTQNLGPTNVDLHATNRVLQLPPTKTDGTVIQNAGVRTDLWLVELLTARVLGVSFRAS